MKKQKNKSNIIPESCNLIAPDRQCREMMLQMKSTEMHVVIDMNAHRQAIGMTKQQLADKMHKDVSVVGKQISENKRSNLMLFNAYEFAEALGGGVKFLTDEQIADLEKIEDLKAAVADADKLREENERLKTENTQAIERINRLKAKLSAKDEAVDRKDILLNKLLTQNELLIKAMRKNRIDLTFLDEI